jgi:hypoxanthine-guanine phosphoribosyltransferase
VEPSKALDLFAELADTLKGCYAGEQILFVGFAETATAIGAQVAVSMKGRYIQTTRETIPDVEYLFFSESHSHATEQKLVKDDVDAVINEVDRIIFVEDEVTTGNTIMNIVEILEKLYPGKIKFSVASLLNGMSDESLKRYRDKDILLHYLVKTDHSTYGDRAERFVEKGIYYECVSKKAADILQFTIPGVSDARRVVNGHDYEKACDDFWKCFSESVGNPSGKNILVVGTEEFMFPALYLGRKLEELGNKVLCHSTTRSPIAVSMAKEYPLHSRYELRSLYDCKRKTFIYDIGDYDKVFIVTDAPEKETEGLNTLINALAVRNENITLIRWC